MGRAVGVFICLLIVTIDTVAGILGIEAGIAQNKGKHVRVLFLECKQPVHQAYRLGIAAVALLGLAHVVANMLGGCTCVCSRDEFVRSSTNRQFATGTLILAWIVLGVGFTVLLVGALSNSKSRVSCGLAHPKFLPIGGILCFVHGIVCMAYYVSATAATWEEGGRVRRDVGV